MVQREMLVIAVGGHHGAGRSTHAIMLAETYGLRYISSGTIFRDMAIERGLSLEEMSQLTEDDPEFDKLIDMRAQEESKKKGVVVDATLSGWMAHEPDLRIFLTTSFDERARRIAEREDITVEEASKVTRVRSESERRRFLEYYNIDISDLSIYDVVINTNLYSPDGTARILKCIVEEYLKDR